MFVVAHMIQDTGVRGNAARLFLKSREAGKTRLCINRLGRGTRLRTALGELKIWCLCPELMKLVKRREQADLGDV